MADLPEVSEFPAGIYQIETTDPVIGGAPNVGTGAGMSNIPHLLLANRTIFLRNLIQAAGLGTTTGRVVTDFDAITTGGLYACADAGATGSPTAAAYTLLHLPGDLASTAIQIAARPGFSSILMRHKTGSVWGSWIRILNGGDLQPSSYDTTVGKLLEVGAFGLGALITPLAANLNSINGTGFYRADATTLNTPPGGGPNFAVISINMGTAGVRLQIALGAGGTSLYWRGWDTGAGNFGAWRLIWHTDTDSFSFAGNGYQRLPSGLIIQWGSATTDAGGTVDVTFPISFPGSLRQVLATDYTPGTGSGNMHIISLMNRTNSGFTGVSTRYDGVLNTSTFSYQAIGN